MWVSDFQTLKNIRVSKNQDSGQVSKNLKGFFFYVSHEYLDQKKSLRKNLFENHNKIFINDFEYFFNDPLILLCKVEWF